MRLRTTHRDAIRSLMNSDIGVRATLVEDGYATTFLVALATEMGSPGLDHEIVLCGLSRDSIALVRLATEAGDSIRVAPLTRTPVFVELPTASRVVSGSRRARP